MIKRGLFHLLGGLFFPVLALFIPETALLVFLGTVTGVFVSFDLLRFRFPRISSWAFQKFGALFRETEASRLTGSSYLLIASLISFLVFRRDIAVLALSFLAVGDPLATIVGSRLGKRKLFGKTLEGTMACLVSSMAIGVILYFCAGLDVALPAILAGSAVATAAEIAPLPWNDNLTIPISVGFVLSAIS